MSIDIMTNQFIETCKPYNRGIVYFPPGCSSVRNIFSLIKSRNYKMCLVITQTYATLQHMHHNFNQLFSSDQICKINIANISNTIPESYKIITTMYYNVYKHKDKIIQLIKNKQIDCILFDGEFGCFQQNTLFWQELISVMDNWWITPSTLCMNLEDHNFMQQINYDVFIECRVYMFEPIEKRFSFKCYLSPVKDKKNIASDGTNEKVISLENITIYI